MPVFAANLLNKTEFWVGTGLLVVVLLVGAVAILLVDRWRKKQNQSELSSTESLTHYREMYENGEITQGEYEVIRARVAEQMRQELGHTPMVKVAPTVDLADEGQAPPAAVERPTSPEQ